MVVSVDGYFSWLYIVPAGGLTTVCLPFLQLLGIWAVLHTLLLEIKPMSLGGPYSGP